MQSTYRYSGYNFKESKITAKVVLLFCFYLFSFIPHPSSLKKKTAPLGEGGGRGKDVLDRCTDMSSDRFRRGGMSLLWPRPGGRSGRPLYRRCRSRSWGMAYLGGRFPVAIRHRSTGCFWGLLAADVKE